ncbi:MAG: DNA translocase FtsK [Spirochaetales bacterium]
MREPFRSWIYRWIPLGLCFFFALFSLGALLLALGNVSSSKSLLLGYYTGLGKILIDSFHFASFFIPLYFAACAYFLFHATLRIDWIVFLNVLLVPFFTLALALRLLFSPSATLSPLPALFQRSFTWLGGGLIALLLFFLELSFLPQIYKWIHHWYKSKISKPIEPLQIAPPSDSTSFSETLAQTGVFDSSKTSENTVESLLLLEDSGNKSLKETTSPQEQEQEGIEEVEKEITEAQDTKSGELPEAEVEEETPEEEAREDFKVEILEEEEEEEEDVEREKEEPSSGEERQPRVIRESSEFSSVPSAALKDKKQGAAYSIPVEGILNKQNSLAYWEIDEETRRAAEVLRTTLEEFKIQAEVVGIRKGPVITMFEILPAPGVKLSRIVNLADNIALRLAAASVRIVAPIPGKHAVGIEVPNKHRAIVTFAEMVSEEGFINSKMEIPIVLGKDIAGEAQIIDLVHTPHLLIAGATGSGKSVCVNSIICSILFKRSPAEVRLILIDPKIVELKLYNDIPHLLTPVITEPKRAFQALQYAIAEMERRYTLLDGMGVRDIRSYNRKIKVKHIATLPLPYLVIIIDEFADLMATTGKELESTLARLAAMSRAVGIHLVLATQRPSIDVITGLIKANIPSRIAFMVASKFDSRIIIDSVGAEKLLGRGDMLFTSAWDPFPLRMQGAFVSEEEIENLVERVRQYGEPDYIDEEIFYDEEEEEAYFTNGEEDPLLEKAIEIVTAAGKASASYLQRRLKIGYNRAARLIELMEHRGIVGPADGSKPRKVL